jgi:hypothetical protein
VGKYHAMVFFFSGLGLFGDNHFPETEKAIFYLFTKMYMVMYRSRVAMERRFGGVTCLPH